MTASEFIELIGESPDGLYPSGLFTQTDGTGSAGNLTIQTGQLTLRDGAVVSASTFGIGNGGKLTIETGRLSVSNGSVVSASTFGIGDAGNLIIRASDEVEVRGENSGLFTNVHSEAEGVGGNLTVETGRLSVSDGAQVSASTFGKGDAGDLTVRASLVELIGKSADGQIPSGLFAVIDERAKGTGGNLTIDTGRLSVRDGARMSTSTFGAENAGDFKVSAIEVELSGTASGLFAQVEPTATGDGGNLTVETERLSVSNGAQVSANTLGIGNGGNVTIDTGGLSVSDGAAVAANTFGTGNAGDLTVRASDLVEVIGTGESGKTSYLSASVQGGTGNAGDLTIETQKLVVRSSQVSASTFGRGNAGNLTVRASDSVELSGKVFDDNIENPAGLFAQVNITGSGRGGNLTIETERLSVSDGSGVQVATFGQGDAGNLLIRASLIDVFETTDANSFEPTGIFAGVIIDNDETVIPPKGNGGDLTIETNCLRVRDGGRVSTTTEGEGNAGTLRIRASESVEVIGTSPNGNFKSEISGAVTPESTGSGGDLTIETGQLNVRDAAQVTVSNQGPGNAGSLRVEGGSLELDNLGKLLASTASGEGGNIDLQVQDLILMRQNSLISAEAGGTGNGGNITINNPFIVAVPSENSDIVANAVRGRGGNINIVTQGIYGLEYRSNLTLESDINASSQFGVSGTVAINTPDVDPSQGLVALLAELVDVSGLIASGCGSGSRQGESKFIVTGRGGLPIRPIDASISPYPTGTVRSIPSSGPFSQTPQSLVEGSDRSTNPTEAAPTSIVEAEGWIISALSSLS